MGMEGQKWARSTHTNTPETSNRDHVHSVSAGEEVLANRDGGKEGAESNHADNGVHLRGRESERNFRVSVIFSSHVPWEMALGWNCQ